MLRTHGRPLYQPPEGLSPDALQQLWDALNQAERDREDALRRALQQEQELNKRSEYFLRRADKLEQWIAGKQKYLAAEEQIDSLNAAQRKVKEHEDFFDEYELSRGRLEQIKADARELIELGAPNAAAVQERVDRLNSSWEALRPAGEQKDARLREQLSIQQRMEQMRLDFARLAKEYNRWSTAQVDSLNDSFFGDTLEAVEQYGRQELEQSTGQIQQASAEKLTAIRAIWSQMEALGISTDLKYTPLTLSNLEQRNQGIEEALGRRRQAYQQELRRQQELEAKRREFASAAAEVLAHLDRRRAQLQQLTGEPDALIELLRSGYAEGAPDQAQLEPIRKLNAEMLDLGINENRHTDHTLASLSARVTQLGSWVNAQMLSLEDEKDLKANYLAVANEIVAWIEETQPTLGLDRQQLLDNSLEGAKQASAKFHQYKTGKKAATFARMPELRRLQTDIVAVLQRAGRPAFVPPAGRAVADIEQLWRVLDAAEQQLEEALAAELSRQERIQFVLTRFQADAQQLEQWAGEKVNYLAVEEPIGSLFDAQFQQKLFEAYQAELKPREQQLQELASLVSQLTELRYRGLDEVQTRYQSLKQELFGEQLAQAAARKQKYLSERLRREEELEELRVSFARSVKAFSAWSRQQLERVRDHQFGYSLESVQQRGGPLRQESAQLAEESDRRAQEALSIWERLQAAGVTENRHTQSTGEDLLKLKAQLAEELAGREQAYQAELQKQTVADEQRRAFASQAADYVGWLAGTRQQLEQLAVSEPAARAEAIRALHQDGQPARQRLEPIEKFAASMRAEGIFGNTHTKESVQTLQSATRQLDNWARAQVAGAQEEAEMAERIRLQEQEQREKEQREQMIFEFSRGARKFNQWLENADELVTAPVEVQTVAAAQRQLDEYPKHEQEVAVARAAEFQALVQLAERMTAAGITDFSGITLAQLQQSWTAVQQGTRSHRDRLTAELARQQSNAKLAEAYQQAGQQLSRWIQQQRAQYLSGQGSVDEQLARVSGGRSSYASESRVQLEQLEQQHSKASAAGVPDLPLRPYQREVDSLAQALEAQEKLLRDQLASSKRGDVTAEQVSEFQEVFRHFDKDGSGKLSRAEIKSGMQALGEELSEQELDAAMAKMDPAKVGEVDLPNFVKFMSERNKDSNSSDEVLQSFRQLAGDKDFVLADELRRMLPAPRVAFLLQAMPAYPGVPNAYDYKQWILSTYGKQ